MNTPNSNARVCQGNIVKAVMQRSSLESATLLSKAFHNEFE